MKRYSGNSYSTFYYSLPLHRYVDNCSQFQVYNVLSQLQKEKNIEQPEK